MKKNNIILGAAVHYEQVEQFKQWLRGKMINQSLVKITREV